eukprot:Awhi_evm1s3981
MGFHWPPFNSIDHLHLHVIGPESTMSFFGKLEFKVGTLWYKTGHQILQRLEATLND